MRQLMPPALLLATPAASGCAANAAANTPPPPLARSSRQRVKTRSRFRFASIRRDVRAKAGRSPICTSRPTRGANWSIFESGKARQRLFVFRAPHDGEYWFSIRTVDAQGVDRPEGPMQPQLKVTVDTVAPRLDLSVSARPGRRNRGPLAGRRSATSSWELFKLEYQVIVDRSVGKRGRRAPAGAR